MSAPKFVPVAPVGAYREGTGLPPAQEWRADRAAEIRGDAPTDDRLGRPGPGQGYAIKLAHLFSDRLHLTPGEHAHDVIDGCIGVANKRAALFGRSPVVHDLEVAFRVFGYLDDDAPHELVSQRKALFEAAGHHYEVQRQIADLVPDSTLRMTPTAVALSVGRGEWRSLLSTSTFLA